MMIKYTPDYNKLKAVKVYLERYTRRIPVGELKDENGIYTFTYYDSYLCHERAIPLGVEFPLTKRRFYSYAIFETFWDRIPSKDSPAYSDYCNQFNISPDEVNILVLLVTIGRKGSSSFVFEPILERSFNGQDVKQFRKSLDLSAREFAMAFDISYSTIMRLENNKTSDSEVLKLLEILSNFPSVAIYHVKKYGDKLHSKTMDKVIGKLVKILHEAMFHYEINNTKSY